MSVAEVKAEFADEEGWPKTSPLPRGLILKWMQEEDLEVSGAVHRLLRYKGGLARVQPPLEFADYYEFMTRYFRRCLCGYDPEVGDPSWGEADYGMEVSHGVVYWFLELWRDKSVPRSALRKVKGWLAEILMECPDVRELLATAIYDHLQRKIRRFFADWEGDPELSRFMG